MIDKSALIAQMVTDIEKEVAELQKSYEHAKETKAVSPGRMQSRYDTMGVEAAWLADSLAKNIDEKRRSIAALRSMNLATPRSRVVLGSVVGVGPEDGGADVYYFIVPSSGGNRYRPHGAGPEILAVTVHAPVAQAMIGAGVGDYVEVRRDQPQADTVKLIE